MVSDELLKRYNECKSLAKGPFETEEQLAEAFFKTNYMLKVVRILIETDSKIVAILDDITHIDHGYWTKLVDKQVIEAPELELYYQYQDDLYNMLMLTYKEIEKKFDGYSGLYYISSFLVINWYSLKEEEGLIRLFSQVYDNVSQFYGVKGVVELFRRLIPVISRSSISINVEEKLLEFSLDKINNLSSQEISKLEHLAISTLKRELMKAGEIIYARVENEEKIRYYHNLYEKLSVLQRKEFESLLGKMDQKERQEESRIARLMGGGSFRKLIDRAWDKKIVYSFCSEINLYLEIQFYLERLLGRLYFDNYPEIQIEDINNITANNYIREKIKIDLEHLADKGILKKTSPIEFRYKWKHRERLQGFLQYIEYQKKKLIYQGGLDNDTERTIEYEKLEKWSEKYRMLINTKEEFSVYMLYRMIAPMNDEEESKLIDHLYQNGIIELIDNDQLAYVVADNKKLGEMLER